MKSLALNGCIYYALYFVDTAFLLCGVALPANKIVGIIRILYNTAFFSFVLLQRTLGTNLSANQESGASH